MLEIFVLKQDNLEEVAKASGRRLEDLKATYKEACATNKAAYVCVDKPDIPEGFMRTN